MKKFKLIQLKHISKSMNVMQAGCVDQYFKVEFAQKC